MKDRFLKEVSIQNSMGLYRIVAAGKKLFAGRSTP